MNERIRELWDKAATTSAAFPSGQNNSWETQVNFMEKFAELIVRECQYAIVSRTDLPKHERKLYNNVLKEHFGVEL